jgi:hypothetical protein
MVSSVPLWLYYMDILASRKRPEEISRFSNHAFSDSGRVLYRAVNACPWSKELWLKAADLREVMGKTEIVELLQTAQQKELRLRVDLDEVDGLLDK